MDPLARTKLQTSISRTMAKARKDDDVMALLNEAQKCLKGRDWPKAKGLYAKALDLFDQPRTVLEVLVEMGAAATKAGARRVIASGRVSVDGVQLRKDGISVTKANKVTVTKPKKRSA